MVTRDRPATSRQVTNFTSTLGRTTRSVRLASGYDIRQVRGGKIGDLFNLFCLSACGGEFSTPSGIIRSPYHPANYPHHRQCKYTIAAPPGNVIQLQFR